MQGMWTVPEDTVDEPFFSDRHKLNADTWFQLQVSLTAKLSRLYLAAVKQPISSVHFQSILNEYTRCTCAREHVVRK